MEVVRVELASESKVKNNTTSGRKGAISEDRYHTSTH